MSEKKKPLARVGNGWSLEERDPQFISSLMPFLEWLYRYYFRVKSDGWHHIPSKGKVFLIGTHNGGLAAPDLAMITYEWFRLFGTFRRVYALTHPNVWKVFPPWGKVLGQIGAVMAHPKMARAALSQDASVLVYPGGLQELFRPYSQRKQIYFAGRKGFIKLALQEEVPITPIISKGAHHTLIVLAECYQLAKKLHQWGMPWLFDLDPEVFPIYLGWPWGVAIGPLPNIPFPVPIHIRVCPPIVFERYGKEAAAERHYVDTCYHLVCQQMQQELDRLFQDN